MATPAPPNDTEVAECEQVPPKLWMGDLEPYMDEAFLTHVFSEYGFTVSSYKWIKNHITGVMAQYCFLEFDELSTARNVLETLNNKIIPGTNGSKHFKLNWASKKLELGMTEYNAFVADLSKDVTSQQLLEYFQHHYKSVRFAKVIEDEAGVSKGYGFVRFFDETEQNRAFEELDNSTGLGTKPIRVKPANNSPKQLLKSSPESSIPSCSTTPTKPSSSVATSVMSPSPAVTPQFPTYPQYLPSPSPTSWPMPQPPYSPHYPMPSYPPYCHPVVHNPEDDMCVDPNAGPTREQQNSSIYNHDRDLFLKLEATRWRHFDSVSTKLL